MLEQFPSKRRGPSEDPGVVGAAITLATGRPIGKVGPGSVGFPRGRPGAVCTALMYACSSALSAGSPWTQTPTRGTGAVRGRGTFVAHCSPTSVEDDLWACKRRDTLVTAGGEWLNQTDSNE